MSLQLMADCWPLDMPTGRKFVLIAICDTSHDDGDCFVCVETIAYKCGMGVRTVQQHLADLEADGFIRREERAGRSSLYFVFPLMLQAAPRHPLYEKRKAIRDRITSAKSAPAPAKSAPAPAKSAPAPAKSAPITVIYTLPNGEKNTYPPEFEAAWLAYPARPGTSKRDARKAWAARVKAGTEPDVILAGVKRYAAYCAGMRTEPQYIKQPTTFFGPGEHYLAEWAVTTSQPRGTANDERRRVYEELTGRRTSDTGSVIDSTAERVD